MDADHKKSSKPNKFLVRLFNILMVPDYQEIICWTSSGISFSINNIPEFTLKVLPLYFKHKNFSSFVRQLNMYSFHKERDTGDLQVYSHPAFVKGEQDKLVNIFRKTSEYYSETKPTTLLENKYTAISQRQKQFNEKISILEQNYQEVANYNKMLLTQILQSKEKERKIEGLLRTFASHFKEVPSFLQAFYKEKSDFEIIRPIAIPLHQQLNNSI